ncbi:MAG: hypothetical protein AAF617_04125, partial [Bacteroidota bacterium]
MLSVNLENSDKYLLIFASCFITKGHGRALIIDSQRGKFDLIPNDMVNFIHNAKSYPIATLYTIYGETNREIVESYLTFMLDNEYGFLANSHIREQFPDIEIKWQHPSKITNSIIDINTFEKTQAVYISIISQLNSLGCEALQIRAYISLTESQLIYLAEAIEKTCIEQLEIYVKYSEEVSQKDLITLLLKYQKISTVIVHAAPK